MLRATIKQDTLTLSNYNVFSFYKHVQPYFKVTILDVLRAYTLANRGGVYVFSVVNKFDGNTYQYTITTK